MRFPRLRLPRPRLSFGRLSSVGGRLMLLYIAYTAVLFVGFLLWTFPHELLVRRVLSNVQTGSVNVDFNAVNFAWYRGYQVSGIRVAAESADGVPPWFECSHLWVRPSLNALVHGNPFDLLLNADLYGGVAQGEVSLADGSVVGNVQWQDLNIGRYRTLTAYFDEGQLAGRVSGQLNFEARGANLNAGQATGEVGVDAASLTGAKIRGFGVPDIHFRQMKLKFALHTGRLEVQDFTATGDLNVQGNGQIVLRDPLEESALNLRVTLETSLATPDAIKGAVALIPRAPGAKPDAPITITGTLAKPRMR
jgi:type II secretion system protein N